jgi:hypothetical protein
MSMATLSTTLDADSTPSICESDSFEDEEYLAARSQVYDRHEAYDQEKILVLDEDVSCAR